MCECDKMQGKTRKDIKKEEEEDAFAERTRDNEIGFEFCIEFHAE